MNMAALQNNEWIKMKLEALATQTYLMNYIVGNEADFVIIKLKEISTVFDTVYERIKKDGTKAYSSEKVTPYSNQAVTEVYESEGDVVMCYSKDVLPEPNQKNFDYHYKYAQKHAAKKNYTAAIDSYLNAALSATTKKSKALILHKVAILYYTIGQYQDAMKYIMDSLALEPHDADSRLWLDRIQRNLPRKV